MNGQMKTFIDRTCPAYTRINGKKFYFIMTVADTGKKAMEKEIIYGTGAWEKGDIKGSKAMTQAYDMG